MLKTQNCCDSTKTVNVKFREINKKIREIDKNICEIKKKIREIISKELSLPVNIALFWHVFDIFDQKWCGHIKGQISI